MLTVILLTVVLRYVINKMVLLEKIKWGKTILKEAKMILHMMLYDFELVFLILFIPFMLWVISGKPSDWDAIYIVGASLLGTIFYTYSYYFKTKDV
ncbi:hypothetical protein LC087_15085 [Bacillus carboniphilus]|uniref:Uncharacterized protein n=1 Tax=Bacillus carboniphilus TaxID=86663 RepID=A0ABY9JUU6_9BACI|nr:hypothetical protein [Bacillus carboniphilus]WLR42078.1 hypothetical protein LC087_15085 [Bacillus carboniphilus]